MQFTNWQTVANISRLTLLNRVAFSMLFLVPLLSGFLKPVRSSVEKANAALDSVEDRTRNAREIAEGVQALAEVGSELLQAQATTPSQITPISMLNGSSGKNEQGLDGWFEWNIGTPFLPRPWALAFVAALLILFADTIFQVWCPMHVKQRSLDEYISHQCHEFSQQPSRRQLELARSVTNTQSPELVELEHQLADEVKNAEGGTRELLLEDLRQLRINLIEIASTQDYKGWTKQNPAAAGICCALYLVAACCIFKLLQEQTVNVLTSAGWWNA